jgi:superfamily II DNA or RNA helicase
MMGGFDEGSKSSTGWNYGDIWAREEQFEGNQVRQLLVPSGVFDTVHGTGQGLEVRNHFGSWPASTPDRPLGNDELWVKLDLGARGGDRLDRAKWHRPTSITRRPPREVLDSYRDAMSFNEEAANSPGLRRPQLGALHAVLGYWTANTKTPATVVMPTGTGKTETMLALLVAARPERLLVLVPSDALRDQVAAKFEQLGVLQQLGIISSAALRPAVGRLRRGFKTVEAAATYAMSCNVIVATPQAINACNAEAQEELLTACTHLFIDEAHHVAAATWSEIRRAFDRKIVVQFTATPFREDGKHLQGRMVYAFPLREAQNQGYFSQIDYTAVFDYMDTDRAVATQSVARLRSDIADGFDHVLMARVRNIERAKEVVAYYEELAPGLNPVIINSQMPKRQQREALAALRDRTSRIIVCVNMLGEGFDLPALKIAAVHSSQKSLGVTLQFIGRFARTSDKGNFGTASAFVARKGVESDPRLRILYAEDADWNRILRELTETVVQEQQDISDFEDEFTNLPEEVSLRSLRPKLTTVVYQAPTSHWEPQNLVEFFGEENLYTHPIGLNLKAGVAWCVVEKHDHVRWGTLKTIAEHTYELYLLYFDEERRLLYINNSANDGVFKELAAEVLGPDAERFDGPTVYRVMADITRLVPTNVGVLDAHDRFRRFSMHVGSDVTASFSDSEASTKSQTNISGSGFREGERVSISASAKGRIWTPAAAESVKQWRDWCDTIGAKLLDETISIEKVIGQFLLPEDLKERPVGVLLAVEWPWVVHTLQSENLKLTCQDISYELVYTDLVPDTNSTSGPFRFAVSTEAWTVPYEAELVDGHLRYRCLADEEITVVRAHSESPLSVWLNTNGVGLMLDDDRIIVDDMLYKPKWEKPAFDPAHFVPMDWTGTNFRVESQGRERRPESIQFRAITELQRDAGGWDIVLDDDGTGEIADVVAMRIQNDELLICLVHCKYAHGDTAGARVADLYEVCGQTQKSVSWRRSSLDPFFETLSDRAARKHTRQGVSPFMSGDLKKLFEIQERARVLRRRMEMVIVQPGLSASGATARQLDLLASTETYLRTTIKAPLTVWCSE